MKEKRDDWPYLCLHHDGLDLSLDGDKLIVSGPIDDATRQFIVANRAAIVETCRGVVALTEFFNEHNRRLDSLPNRVIGVERLNRKA